MFPTHSGIPFFPFLSLPLSPLFLSPASRHSRPHPLSPRPVASRALTQHPCLFVPQVHTGRESSALHAQACRQTRRSPLPLTTARSSRCTAVAKNQRPAYCPPVPFPLPAACQLGAPPPKNLVLCTPHKTKKKKRGELEKAEFGEVSLSLCANADRLVAFMHWDKAQPLELRSGALSHHLCSWENAYRLCC